MKGALRSTQCIQSGVHPAARIPVMRRRPGIAGLQRGAQTRVRIPRGRQPLRKPALHPCTFASIPKAAQLLRGQLLGRALPRRISTRRWGSMCTPYRLRSWPSSWRLSSAAWRSSPSSTGGILGPRGLAALYDATQWLLRLLWFGVTASLQTVAGCAARKHGFRGSITHWQRAVHVK